MAFSDRTKWTIMLAQQRTRFLHAFTGLTEEQLFSVADDGGWTMADIFAHTTAWDVHGAGLTPDILAGKVKDVPPVDDAAFDRQAFADIRARGFVSALNDLLWSRRALLSALARASDDAINHVIVLPSGLRLSIRNFAIDEQIRHEGEHADHARAARKARGVKLSHGPKPLLNAALAAAHDYLMECVACVPAGAEATLHITGNWTLKDVLGHIADWHMTVANAAEDALAGNPLTEVQFSLIQEWNEEHAAERTNDSWDKVKADYHQSWQRVIGALARIGEADFPREAAMGERGPIALYPWMFIAAHHEDEHAGFLSQWIMSQG
jgi:hypothetical protein